MTWNPEDDIVEEEAVVSDNFDTSDPSEEPGNDDSDAAVTFDGDRPVVHELEYQAPKLTASAEDDEGADTRFSSVAEAKAVVEGFLFSCNEPLSVQKLSKLLGYLHPKTVRGLLLELQWDYENHHGALQVIEIAGGYQLCTRAFVAPWMFRLHKHKRRSALSPATLETLAIIAYRQPITKGEIEGIRGVESGAPVRTLQDLNLVEASGRREVVGRPQLYVTTEQFLKTFGLKSVADLPSISELKSRFAEEQKLKPAIAAQPQEVAEETEMPDESNSTESSDTSELSDRLEHETVVDESDDPSETEAAAIDEDAITDDPDSPEDESDPIA